MVTSKDLLACALSTLQGHTDVALDGFFCTYHGHCEDALLSAAMHFEMVGPHPNAPHIYRFVEDQDVQDAYNQAYTRMVEGMRQVRGDDLDWSWDNPRLHQVFVGLEHEKAFWWDHTEGRTHQERVAAFEAAITLKAEGA